MVHSCGPTVRRCAPAWPLLVAALTLGAAGRGDAQATVTANNMTYRVITLKGQYSDGGRFTVQPWFTGSSSTTPGDTGTLLAAALAASSPDVEGL